MLQQHQQHKVFKRWTDNIFSCCYQPGSPWSCTHLSFSSQQRVPVCRRWRWFVAKTMAMLERAGFSKTVVRHCVHCVCMCVLLLPSSWAALGGWRGQIRTKRSVIVSLSTYFTSGCPSVYGSILAHASGLPFAGQNWCTSRSRNMYGIHSNWIPQTTAAVRKLSCAIYAYVFWSLLLLPSFKGKIKKREKCFSFDFLLFYFFVTLNLKQVYSIFFL